MIGMLKNLMWEIFSHKMLSEIIIFLCIIFHFYNNIKQLLEMYLVSRIGIPRTYYMYVYPLPIEKYTRWNTRKEF